MTILTNAGRAIITNRLLGSGTAPSYIGWGTGSTAEAAAQTALVTPSAEARSLGTLTQQTTSVTNDTYQVVATITSLSGQTIQEIGVFDATAAGNMAIRALTGGQSLGAGDSITWTVKVQIN